MFRSQPKQRRAQVKGGAILKITKPIKQSVKFLRAILDFWLDPKNKPLLYKEEYKKFIGNDFDTKRKKDLYDKVWKIYNEFSQCELIFTEQESEDTGISKQEYTELSKQCFYLNLYNALILFKLAEISSFQPKKIFELKNYSSWLALEQNSRITIS